MLPLVLVALVGALWVVVFALLQHLERATLAEASAARRNLARSLSESAASSVRAIDIALVSLRNGWVRERAAFDELVRLHEDLLRKEKVIQVAVLDREGWIRYSRLPQSGPVNFSDREYFAVQRGRASDEIFISTPVFGRVTRQWAIQMTRPIRSADGRFDGLIVVAVPPPALERLYHDMDLGPRSIVTLARLDGRILARSADFERSVEVPLAATPPGDSGARGAGEFVGSGNVDGTPRFIAYRNVPDYPLRIYVGQDIETVMAPFRQERAYIVGLAVAATLLLLGLGAVMMMRLRERARYQEEREELMLDLHDGCIQAVYAIGLNLQECRGLANAAAADRAIAQAQADLNLVIQDLRGFISGERATRMAPAEFVEEIRRSAPFVRAPELSIDIDQDIVRRLAPEQASHLLRIVREAVSNVVRHAGAAACRISLAQAEGRNVRLEISDDGKGMSSEAPRGSSLGIAHIHARAKRMGGAATIVSVPDRGTTITVSFPASP